MRARRAVAALAVVTAVAAVTAQVVEGPAGSGYGWGWVVISSLLLAVPLLGLGFIVRNGDPRYAALAVVLALVLVVVVEMAVIGNWSGQSATDRALDAGVSALIVLTAGGTVALELPLLSSRGPQGRR